MTSRVTFDNNKKYMDDDQFTREATPKLAAPIDIPSPSGLSLDSGEQRNRRKTRRRRDSEASSSLSSLSETFSESPSPTTPPTGCSPTQGDVSPDIATSPILSYFVAHASPIKSARHFSFRDKPKMATSPGAANTLEGDYFPFSILLSA
jgi:hypothetical protein